MFCTKCGKEIPEGNQYCTSCGAAINSNMAGETPVGSEINVKIPDGKPESKKKRIIIGICVAIVVLIFIAAVSGGDSTVDTVKGGKADRGILIIFQLSIDRKLWKIRGNFLIQILTVRQHLIYLIIFSLIQNGPLMKKTDMIM